MAEKDGDRTGTVKGNLAPRRAILHHDVKLRLQSKHNIRSKQRQRQPAEMRMQEENSHLQPMAAMQAEWSASWPKKVSAAPPTTPQCPSLRFVAPQFIPKAASRSARHQAPTCVRINGLRACGHRPALAQEATAKTSHWILTMVRLRSQVASRRSRHGGRVVSMVHGSGVRLASPTLRMNMQRRDGKDSGQDAQQAMQQSSDRLFASS